uniref:(northern house mosquito) hypothetical protein n=1 Tax=Culex pipiens TaxID=7175 RepID=A0A8D8HF17_CULPI
MTTPTCRFQMSNYSLRLPDGFCSAGTPGCGGSGSLVFRKDLSVSEIDALAVRNCWLTSSFSSIATPSLTGIESGSNITNRLPLIRFHPAANDFQQIDSNPARRAGSSEHMLVKEGGVVPVQKRTMATTSTRKEPTGQFNRICFRCC